MAHDKIKAAARRRMAKTGESHAAARREVIREFRAAGGSDPAGEPEWFAISYKDMGPISTWADTRRGGGPAGGRIEVGRLLADRPPLPEVSAAVGAESERSGSRRPAIAAPNIRFGAASNHGMHTSASRHNGGSGARLCVVVRKSENEPGQRQVAPRRPPGTRRRSMQRGRAAVLRLVP
jgi:hypothetical protein